MMVDITMRRFDFASSTYYFDSTTGLATNNR